MTITGDKNWLKRLRNARDVSSAMEDWAKDGAEQIAQEAIDLVNDGGIPSPNHVVSAPGQPPNTDSGNLAANIQPVALPDPLHYAVVSQADYGAYLELGTSKMIERPYLRPAARIMKIPLLLDAASRIRKATSKRG